MTTTNYLARCLPLFKNRLPVVSAVLAAILLVGSASEQPARAATFTWDGGGADGDFSTAANWNPDSALTTINTHDFTFGPLVATSPQTTANVDLGGNPRTFTFAAGLSDPMTLTGNALQLGPAVAGTVITNNSSQLQTINNQIRIFHNLTFSAASGDLSLNNIVFRSDGPFPDDKILTLTGSADGSVGLLANESTQPNQVNTIYKTGTGTWYLTNTSDHTGRTVFEGGILNVASLSDYGVASAIGARTFAQETAAGDGIGLHFRGGTLQYTGSTPQSTNRQIRMLTGNGAIIDASGSDPSATLSFTHSGPNINLFDTGGTRTLTLTGTNTGANLFAIPLTNQSTNATSLSKTGSGTWEITGNSSFSGTTTISDGVLRIAHNNALGSTAGGTTVVGGTSQGRLELQGGLTVSGETLTLQGKGTGNDSPALSNFSGNNTWTGNINLTTGGNQYNIASQADTLNISGNISQIAGGGDRFLNVMGTGNTNVTGQVLDGTASLVLTKTGGGSLALRGNNNYSGGTTLSEGVILSGHANGLGTGPVSIAADTNLLLWWNTNTSTVNNPISLNGLGGPVPGGNKTAVYADGGAGGHREYTLAGPVTLNATSNLGGNTNNNLRVSGQITGPGGLTKGGGRTDENNTLVLANPANNYAGDTAVTKGSVLLAASEVIPHGPGAGIVTIAAGTSVNLGGYSETINNLAGSGTVTSTASIASPVFFTNDAGTGLSSGKSYTHAINFASPPTTSVNGVPFDNAGSWSLAGATNATGNAATGATGDIHNVLTNFNFGGNPATLTLGGLAPGQTYESRLYQRFWGGDRTQLFTLGAGPASATLVYNEDASTTPSYLAFRFTADASGVATITTNQVGGGTYHWYGLTNELVQAPVLTVGDSSNSIFSGTITSNLGLTKTGSGSLTLSGNNTYSGETHVDAGTLALQHATANNIASSPLVQIAAGGTLDVTGLAGGTFATTASQIVAGSGHVVGTVGGAGLVSPGNSPGILTVGQVDPSLDLNFAFEFTAPGSPDYTNPGASINDVLRITHATDPFTSALTGGNTVDLYLNVATLETDVFRGGFYTDRGSDFWGDISAANFNIWVLGDGMGGAASFGGNDYYSFSQYLPGASLEMSTVFETASFNGGPVGGYVFQLSVVPEPETFALGLLAAVGVALLAWRRRR